MGCAPDDDPNTATCLLYFGVEVPHATTQTATDEQRARLMRTDRIKTAVVVVDVQNDYDLTGKCAATRCAFGAAAWARGGPTRSRCERADRLQKSFILSELIPLVHSQACSFGHMACSLGLGVLPTSRRSPIASLVSCAPPSARRSFVVFGSPVVLPTSSPSAVALRWQLRPRIDRCDGRAHPDEGLDDKRKPQNAAACKLRRTGKVGRTDRQSMGTEMTSRC